VLFAPEDLSLVRGDPAVRRRFLDEAVVARNPALAGVIGDYERVVRQRTALLKSVRSGNRSAVESTIEVWDAQLIELGVRIMLARRSLVDALSAPLRSGYEAIVEHDHGPAVRLSESVLSASEKYGVSRETSANGTEGEVLPGGDRGSHVSRETLEESFRLALAGVRRQEFERGVTLVGPHRDDAVFELNGLPVKGYASHGESWSFALALRLGLAELLREESPAGDPVIILDDVFAELDVRRRNALMSQVKRFEQVIVTAAVEGDVPAGEWNAIRIDAGQVVDSESTHGS
jgi:DNA replication and repair protein RecF